MLDQAEEIICFAAIIEHGSITKAGERLNRSKAHVSRKLSNLEARYKVKLFHRSTRSMRLTDAGEKLQANAVILYHEHQKLDQIAKHVQSDLSGVFGISVSDSSASFLLAPILPKLFAQFPDIQFDIHITNEPVDLIGQKIDLAIRSGDVGDENLVARRMGMVREKMYAASGNDMGALDIQTIGEIRNYKLLTNEYSLKDGKLALFEDDNLTYIEPTNLVLVNRYKIILDILRESNFIAVLPDYAAKQALETGEIVNILPQWHNGEWPLFMLHPFQMPLPIKLKAVCQFMVDHFSTQLKS